MDEENKILIEIQPVRKLSRYSPCMQYALDVMALAKEGHDISGEFIRPANKNEKLNNILHQILIYQMIQKNKALSDN